MSLSTYYLEDDRHLARLHHRRRRRRAHAPTSNTTSHITMRKSLHGLPLVSYMDPILNNYLTQTMENKARSVVTRVQVEMSFIFFSPTSFK